MFKFGKKKKYSIGEKIRYFDSIINIKNISNKKLNWAIQRKNQLLNKKNNIKLGDVFIVNDRFMGNPNSKPRLVVVAKVSGNKVKVIPVKKSNTFMSLENFDGCRSLNMINVKTINKNILYEKKGFKINKRAFLNPKEKVLLQKKVNDYIN